MSEVLLNGREPLERELSVIEFGRQCERERDLAQLAGVLTEEAPAERVARPVTDVVTGTGMFS